MRTDLVHRRMLLTGALGALTIPFLRSLAPKSAHAEEILSPVRYIQILNMYGARADQIYGQLAPGKEVHDGVFATRLKDIDGELSPLVGRVFDPLREKLSLIQGMDAIEENANHNLLFATCASGYALGLDGQSNPPLSEQPSVDAMMAGSDRVYEKDTPATRRLLVLNPGDIEGESGTSSFSWQPSALGKIEMVRPTKSTLGLLDILGGSFGKLEGASKKEQLLLNTVYADFQRVRDETRLSKTDKERLENYMTLLSDVARGPVVSCSQPALDPEEDWDFVFKNQFRLLTAALLCNVTRVVSIGHTMLAADAHAKHHDKVAYGQVSDLDDDFARVGRRVAELGQMLDEVSDGDGTLLDNSIIYWSMQYGHAMGSNAHNPTNFPAVVLGKGGGALRSGYHIDYRKDGALGPTEGRGVPLNNLLVTFMNCMGMGSADYEAEGRAGYGYYNTRFFESELRPNTEFWASTEGRRSPLPYLYQGEERG